MQHRHRLSEGRAMGLSKSKAEQRGSVKVNGREYVTQVVAAQRLGVTQAALSKDTKKGKYSKVELEGYEGKWFDWNLLRVAFNKQRMNPQDRKGGRRDKKDGLIFAASKVSDKTPGVPSDKVPEVTTPDLPENEVLSYFDPNDPANADCWETDQSGAFLYVPNTNPPMHYVDWKKATDKCMANLRYQQYKEKQKELISKQEVVQILSLIFPTLTASVMQIPDRYASRLNGRLEDMIGRTMTNEERTLLKSVLQDEAEQICHNFQDSVQKVIEDSGNTD